MTKIKIAYRGLFSAFLLISFVFIILPSPVFAAKSVKGTVPDLPPLQPAPTGIAPNYSGNINYIGSPEEQNSSDDEKQSISQPQKPSVSEPRHSKIFWLFGPQSRDETTTGAIKNFSFLIFVLLVLGAGAYYFWREKK